jgi:hypothetical protein
MVRRANPRLRRSEDARPGKHLTFRSRSFMNNPGF